MKSAARILPCCFWSTILLCLGGCGGYRGGNPNGGGTIPLAPAGLVATGANGQVNLTWNASSGATGHSVKRSTTAGNESQIATQPTTSYADSAVSNGTRYFYVVSAYNSYGQSSNSSEVSATPTLPVPPAPSGLTAAAGNAQVSLTWNSSTGATSYHVKRSTTNGSGYTQIGAP